MGVAPALIARTTSARLQSRATFVLLECLDMSDTEKTLLEFKEGIGNAALEQAHETYDLAYERILKLLPVLVGAASAVGVYGLRTAHGQPTLGVTLLAAAIWWCLVAAYAVLHGTKSNEVSTGSDLDMLESRYQQHFTHFADEAKALRQVREDQLSSVRDQVEKVSKLASMRSFVLDVTYRALVIGTPFALFGGYLVARRWPEIF
jgi:hypothetical protein